MDASRLLDAQRARKAAQEDKLRLSNRVKQLEREERRAHKRIVQTKARAEEIVQLRQRNLEKQIIKEAVKRAEKEELSAMRMGQYQRKGEHLERKRAAMERHWEQKAMMSDELRAAKEEYVMERAMFNQAALVKAQRSKEYVRKSHAIAAAKQHTAKQLHNQKVKEEYENRLADEKQVLYQNELELAQMAQLELQLIQRLRLKQELQAEAYNELQEALGLPKVPLPTAQGPEPAADEPDENKVREEFAKLDPEGTGYVGLAQVGGLLEALGLHLEPNQLEEAVQQLSSGDTEGQVSFGDFLLWWNG